LCLDVRSKQRRSELLLSNTRRSSSGLHTAQQLQGLGGQLALAGLLVQRRTVALQGDAADLRGG